MNFLPDYCPLLVRRLTLQALLFMAPFLALGQQTGTVTGHVRDAGTREALKSATVTLRDAADSTARALGDVADDDGAFSVDGVPLGRKYRMVVDFIGYEKHVVEEISLTAAKPDLNLGEILLKQSSIDMEGVAVTSRRSPVTVMADKTVYAVENNTAYTATNVSELLGQIPTVQVDQDGNVSLRGSNDVTIMVNDRPLMMPVEQRNKFLQSLPAASVSDIEIRTNPGAQFDARNQGGIINIITRRTMSDMIGGNVNAGIDTRLGMNGGLGLYYNGEGLNASVGGGVHRNKHEGMIESFRIDRLNSAERFKRAAGTSESESGSYNGYGQVDYNFTENDVLSMSFNLNQWRSDYTSRGAHVISNANDELVSRFYDTSSPGEGSNGGYNSASMLLKHTFSRDHKIGLDLAYNSNSWGSDNDYVGVYHRPDGTIDSARTTSRSNSSERSNASFITSLDYELPITESFKVSIGGKNEINRLDNSTTVNNRDRVSGEMVLDTLQTNHYLPENTIYALYGNLAYRPVQEIGVQFGVRMERANVSAEYASGQSIISKDYTNYFPSGSLSWNATEQHSFTLSYRRSVALPDIDALNPTKVRWNDYYEYSGNADLEPEFTQSFELSYNTFWGVGNMITVSPFYSTTTGSIERSEQLVNGVTYSSHANFNGSYSVGSEGSLMLRPLSWLSMNLSGSLFNKVNRGGSVFGDLPSSAWGYTSNANVNADLLEGMTLTLTMHFNRPAMVGGSRQNASYYSSFGLRQRLLDNKLNLTLRVNDPFNLQKWESTYDSPEFFMDIYSKWTSRVVALNISYTFGTTPRMEQHRQDRTETKGGGGSGGAGGGQ